MESSLRRVERNAGMARFPWRALGVSLGLHALVLAAVAPPRASIEMANVAPLNASLRPPEAAALLLPAPAAEHAPPAAKTPQRPPAPAPVVAVSPAPTLADVASRAADRPEVMERAGTAAETGAARPTGEPATGLPPGAAATAVQGAIAAPLRVEPASDAAPDAAGLRKFRLAIAGEARGLRRYPEAARRAGLTGTVEVRVSVRSGGAVRQAELYRSSGHAVLDAAALDMLGRAARRADLPESLRGRDFAVLLPVAFEVEE